MIVPPRVTETNDRMKLDSRLDPPEQRAVIDVHRSAHPASIRVQVDLTTETIDLGPITLELRRPPSADELIDEERFANDEFMPYWAELWPSGVELARAVAARELAGLRVLELGCGLAVPSLAAAAGGARVLATDWAEDAIALLRQNAERNSLTLDTALVRWTEPEPVAARAPWDLVLGADLLYEPRNVDALLELLPQLGSHVLLTEPGRPTASRFFEQAAASWEILRDGRLYELRR
jgi:predicted nicotinamide N-methyase